ncbi:MAG: DUF1566 domain-containing protein [Prolixibacteraceae bacterium]
MKAKWIFVGLMTATLFNACDKDISTEVVTDNLPAISAYPIVGTNQSTSYNNATIISLPGVGQDYYGQNSNYPGITPSYTDNGDGTVTDNVTGLMWQNTLDHNGDSLINVSDKLTYDEILALPDTCTTGGHTDWRVPSIKEQYSLMNFNGNDVSGYEGDTDGLTPFVNSDYFGFNYGDTDAGERIIDVQCASTTLFVGNSEMVFGVNFADGRIKGYGMTMMGEAKKFNYLLCRGNANYGQNSFSDNGDGTITDAATGLMWMQEDSKTGMNWKDALSYAESFTYAGHSDWRLPDVKELQSLVDYTRSPETTSSAAIDPLFKSTPITNEIGEDDYPFYWSSTTHANMTSGSEGGWGAYVCFGRAMGNDASNTSGLDLGTPPAGGTPPDGIAPPDGMTPPDETTATTNWIDVHGAGAQRSDPKDGDAGEYSEGHGPQGDAVRILNYVRLVRNK